LDIDQKPPHGKQFRLGDKVRVKVARINAFRSEIDFELLQTDQVDFS
jgi:exoribonuclease R